MNIVYGGLGIWEKQLHCKNNSFHRLDWGKNCKLLFGFQSVVKEVYSFVMNTQTTNSRVSMNVKMRSFVIVWT